MPFQDKRTSHTFKIAIVGGGRRCFSFLKLLELKKLNRLNVDIAGIADINTMAVGFQYARQKGIFTTTRYQQLFDIPGLELILNLTGDIDFSHELNAATPCDSPDSPCPMKETLKTGQSAHAIHEHIHHDKEQYCDVSTFPILNSKGEIAQVLEVVRDITAEMNDRLDHRTRAIKNDLARLVHEDKIISLGKMVASVAHEINNPIGSIINFNKLILKIIEQGRPTDKELEDFKRYLHLTVREAQRCGKIVNNKRSVADLYPTRKAEPMGRDGRKTKCPPL